MDVLDQIANEQRERLGATMRDITLMRLVEAGIIQPEEDGDVVEPDWFEGFWQAYKEDVDSYAYWCITRPVLARYENAHNADGATSQGAYNRNCGVKSKLLLSAFALFFSVLALLLIFR